MTTRAVFASSGVIAMADVLGRYDMREESLDDASQQPHCRRELLLLSRGKMRADRLRKPVFACRAAGLEPTACRLCQRQHDLPAVGGIGRSADQAGLLQRRYR